ncbi:MULTISPECIES: hypothetical protein [unclassified Streptomyces]|uniref:hypothetical protein n=1 Tax=unclassified Streptomyces TaxID=2593676 RepID=UPI000B1F751D|nr:MULTISPECIES: hypothetical protein [unclassified Streptomyces]
MTQPLADDRPLRSPQSEEDAILPPRADCIADSAGGLTFDVLDGGESGPAHLVLVRRGAEDDVVRLPLTPVGRGRLRAVLPSSVELAEGRWDAQVRIGDARARRLTPGVNDLRALVDRAPSADAGRIAVRIPYATKHGNLSVRSWLRGPHAEAGALTLEETRLTVRGRLYGAGLGDGAYVELDAGESVLRAEVTAERSVPGGFLCVVDYAALTEGVWKLWLRPEGEAGPRVRLSRLLDDIPDKHDIFHYPRTAYPSSAPKLHITPAYTPSNDLTLTTTPAT